MDSIAAELLREAVQSRGHGWLKVGGRSMWPLLRTGDEVKIERATAGGIRVLDIAAAETGGQIMVHRFMGMRGSQMVLQGDFYPGSRHALPSTRLLGKVTGFRRGGREHGLGRARLWRSYAFSLALRRIGQVYRWYKNGRPAFARKLRRGDRKTQ